MKKKISVLLALIMILSSMSVFAISSNAISSVWEQEPNGTLKNADRIELNTRVYGKTKYNGIPNADGDYMDRDMYTFTLTEYKRVVIKVNYDNPEDYDTFVVCTLWNDSGEVLEGFENETIVIGLAAGTYYLEIDGNDVHEYNFVVSSEKFPDVFSDDWYYDAVNYVVDKGYFSGYADGTFGPGKNIIRQDFAVVMAKAAGANLNSQSTANLNFPDVDKNGYYAKALAWCVQNGIISGYSNGKFGPTDPITREQICVMINNYEVKVKKNFVFEAEIVKQVDSSGSWVDYPEEDTLLSKYPDNNIISSWARKAVFRCLRSSVISGANGGTVIQPTAYANRAQIATIFMNLSKKNYL